MKKSILILFALLAVHFQPVFGWGQKGHDIVARIAEQHLTRRAKKNITQLLDGKSIVYYSSWMDNLRNSPYWEGGYDVTRTWHYANVDEGRTYETMTREPAGDVLTAIDLVVSGLRSGELTDSMRVDYLRMLVHMVGDLHCPMHAGRLSDIGGNRRQVQWFGQSTNLHSVWDTKFLESARKWSHTEWQEQLDRCNKKQIKEIQAGTVRDWFGETVAAARELYDASPEGANLGYEYLYTYNDLLERQLLYAGYRLASLLNELFG